MRAKLWWVAIAAVLVAAASLSVVLQPGSRGSLDPDSPAPDGSKALVSVLGEYGVRVRESRDPSAAGGRVVVTDPAAYGRRQLAELSTRAHLVLLGGGRDTLAALGVRGGPSGTVSGRTEPGCDWAGARAAGVVDLPSRTPRYSAAGVTACYGGAVLRGPDWVLLGTSRLVRNDTVARTGVAALDVNAISAGRSVSEVTWLLPGTSASAQSPSSAWALFPDGARRAFVWLAVVGGLLVLWLGRRFGRVVPEPLPIVVRAAESVEGHGRLYRRASARERAAELLRAGSRQRLGARLGLPRGTPPAAVAAAVAEHTGRSPAAADEALLGPPPRDDAALVRLASALDELEAAAGIAFAGTKGPS